jgi:hypothetical protein
VLLYQILEKRSKNTVAWKGSEAILGPFLDPDVKEQLESLRRDINNCINEEAMLDHWMMSLGKSSVNPSPMSCQDIIDVLYNIPPANGLLMPSRQDLVDDMGKPKHSLLAIHAPYDSVVQIPTPDLEGQSHGQLFVGTKDAMRLAGEASSDSTKRRKLSYEGRIASKTLRTESKVDVYVLSTYFDEEYQKVALSELKMLSPDVVEKERTSSWDLAESLANEGVSDFMAEEEAVA